MQLLEQLADGWRGNAGAPRQRRGGPQLVRLLRQGGQDLPVA